MKKGLIVVNVAINTEEKPASAAPEVSEIPVIFIGNARCYHTMDWYRNAKRLPGLENLLFVTDLIESESHARLVRVTDRIVYLVNIDRFLLKTQSRLADLWRNIIKALMIPAQVWKTRQVAKANSHHAQLCFHAHTMYYMMVCSLAKVRFVGMPQGSEILVRPKRSRIYHYFAVKALQAADKITVDSVRMKDEIQRLSGCTALVIQNGIAADVIRKIQLECEPKSRHVVLSNRGFSGLYRIDQILHARNRSCPDVALTLTYPFKEEFYRMECLPLLTPRDRDLGRLPTREDSYRMLCETLLVVSIPNTDSSPRSVYEAIFCGCCVAVTYHGWIDSLPSNMKSRLYIVDLSDLEWLPKAIEHARLVTETPFSPSEETLNSYDEMRTIKHLRDVCYPPFRRPICGHSKNRTQGASPTVSTAEVNL